MKKKLIKLLVATMTVSVLGMTNAFAENQETKINGGETTTGAALSVTTGTSVNVTTPSEVEIETDVFNVIKAKYKSYFDVNSDVTSVEDIISKVYKSLDSIDVENNPDFTSLSEGKEPYNILCDIENNYSDSIDETTLENITQATIHYEIYTELSKDGGYIFQAYDNFEESDSIKDTIKNYMAEYNYNNSTAETFKSDIESYLNTQLNKSFILTYNASNKTKFKLPTLSSTGYIYIVGDLTDSNGNSITINFETILQKLQSSNTSSSSSTSTSTTSSGSSSHNSSSGGSSSSSNSSDSSTSTVNNNTSATSSNTNTTDGQNILKDNSGNILTGWQKVNGNWYLANKEGKIETGWQQVNGVWYLLQDNGAMMTGWQKVNGTWYYLQESGAMKRGWYQDTNSSWYLLKEDGTMTTGWYQDTNGTWYYLQGNGAMLANATTPDGYYVGSTGAWE